MIVDTRRITIHAHAIDPEGGEAELDDATTSALLASGTLFDYQGTDDGTTGFVSTVSGSLVVASRPVLTSEGEGPIMGSVVLARWVDERLVSELSEVTKLDVTLDAAAPGGPAPGDEQIENIDSETLSATTALADVDRRRR
jgi:sensor domain CHASE-containing protein